MPLLGAAHTVVGDRFMFVTPMFMTALSHTSFYLWPFAVHHSALSSIILGHCHLQAASQDPKEWRLLFHCFSNTGWYTFGAVIEGLLTKAATMMQHVVGSVVDSAPHAQVTQFLLLLLLLLLSVLQKSWANAIAC